MPVISSWKYAGAWAKLNGTFMYLNLLKGDLNVCFWYRRLIQRYVVVCCSKIQGSEISGSIQFWEDIFCLLAWAMWIFCVTLLRSSVVYDQMFSSITLWYHYDGSWPAGVSWCEMTFAGQVTSQFYLLPTGSAAWLWGKVFGKLGQRFPYL